MKGDYYKEWQLEFGGTGHVTRDGTGMTDYTPAEPGSTRNISGGTFVLLEGFGYIDVITRPQGGSKTPTQKRVELALDAKRNQSSVKMSIETSGKYDVLPEYGVSWRE